MPALSRSALALLAALVLVLTGAGSALAQVTPGATPTATPAPAAPVLSAALSTSATPVGRAVAVAGTLQPPSQVVVLERYRGGAWHGVARVAPSAAGSFRFVVVPDAPGWWRYRVRADGGAPARVELPPLDVFRSYTYSVTTKGSVGAEGAGFPAAVASIYADPRGWVRAHRRFTRVPSGGDLTVVLSEARLVRSFSSACSSAYSCRVGRWLVINADRWRTGARAFPGRLPLYRHMVLNHETGHWLGLGHASCPGPGAAAPLMQQQSKGMQGCQPNAWPLPSELGRVRR